ncbi:hypothetical protein D3C79_789090 [compost metagenome]
MTVLPVTSICSSGTPSRSRLSRALVVGAKCRSAITPVRRRLASSGQGCCRLPVRSPASTWPMGMCRWNAARPAMKLVVVSPWTSTISGLTCS